MFIIWKLGQLKQVLHNHLKENRAIILKKITKIIAKPRKESYLKWWFQQLEILLFQYLTLFVLFALLTWDLK